MIKEELEKEAEEWLCNNLHSASEEDFIKAMVDIAEPREKRIAELENQLEEKDKRIEGLEAQIEKMKEKLKADLIARLKEQMQYSTSPSCTKGMELFIKSIEKWEIKENEKIHS